MFIGVTAANIMVKLLFSIFPDKTVFIQVGIRKHIDILCLGCWNSLCTVKLFIVSFVWLDYSTCAGWCELLCRNYILILMRVWFRFRAVFLLTAPTGKPVGFWLPSVACNRTPFAGFGVTSVNLFESGLLLPSSPTITFVVNFCFSARKYSQSP